MKRHCMCLFVLSCLVVLTNSCPVKAIILNNATIQGKSEHINIKFPETSYGYVKSENVSRNALSLYVDYHPSFDSIKYESDGDVLRFHSADLRLSAADINKLETFPFFSKSSTTIAFCWLGRGQSKIRILLIDTQTSEDITAVVKIPTDLKKGNLFIEDVQDTRSFSFKHDGSMVGESIHPSEISDQEKVLLKEIINIIFDAWMLERNVAHYNDELIQLGINKPETISIMDVSSFKLISGERALRAGAVFANRGRNSMFRQLLYRPQKDRFVELLFNRLDFVNDYYGKGERGGSGGGTEIGKYELVFFDSWSTRVLHEHKFINGYVKELGSCNWPLKEPQNEIRVEWKFESVKEMSLVLRESISLLSYQCDGFEVQNYKEEMETNCFKIEGRHTRQIACP